MNQQFKTDLRNLLSDITHEVLRNKPPNVIECIREYLVKIFNIRECRNEAYKSVKNICDFACIVVDIVTLNKLDKNEVINMLMPIFQDNSSIVFKKDSLGESQMKSMELFLNDSYSLYRRQKSEIRKSIKERLIFYLFNDFYINTDEIDEESSTISENSIHSESEKSTNSESHIFSDEFYYNRAATIVQAVFRGYITRKKLKKPQS